MCPWDEIHKNSSNLRFLNHRFIFWRSRVQILDRKLTCYVVCNVSSPRLESMLCHGTASSAVWFVCCTQIVLRCDTVGSNTHTPQTHTHATHHTYPTHAHTTYTPHIRTHTHTHAHPHTHTTHTHTPLTHTHITHTHTYIYAFVGTSNK